MKSHTAVTHTGEDLTNKAGQDCVFMMASSMWLMDVLDCMTALRKTAADSETYRPVCLMAPCGHIHDNAL